MKEYLPIFQIIVALLLIFFILLQQRGQALGGVFGGGGEFYAVKRGLQKKIFYFTIFLGALFIILSILSLLL
jgi:protein translocase SecG subunit